MSPSSLSCFSGVIIYLQVIRPWGQVLDLFYGLCNGNTAFMMALFYGLSARRVYLWFLCEQVYHPYELT